MVEFGVAFFKGDLFKNMSQPVIYNGFFTEISIKGSINRKIVYIVNAILKCQLAKSSLPFRDYDFCDFFIQSLS